MPVTPTYPGVYVQEVPSGVRTIAGVSTSVGLFIGRAKKGPLNEPKLCLSYSDFERVFTSKDAGSELVHSVRLFFQNGGTQCYVMRIAKGVVAAAVNLKNEAKADVLTATARSPGLDGEATRMAVTYSGLRPESTFNLEVFQWVQNSQGDNVKSNVELYTDLSMDPNSGRYAVDVVNNDSNLVTLTDCSVPPAVTVTGYSQSGRPVPSRTDGIFRDQWQTLIGSAVTTNKFRISVDGQPFVQVDLSSIQFGVVPLKTAADTLVNLPGVIESAINGQLFSGGVTVTMEPGPAGPTGEDHQDTVLLRITPDNGDVLIEPAASDALAGPLMLGSAQGGLEVSRYAASRPAPTGIVFDIDDLVIFAGREQTTFDTFTVDAIGVGLAASLQTSSAVGARMYQDGYTPSVTGNSDGVREKWDIIAAAINDERANDPTFTWAAQVWGSRLALIPTAGGDNLQAAIATSAINIDSDFVMTNVRYYSLGTSGQGDFQAGGVAGNDGSAPELGDYGNAYQIAEREIDLFNLLVLPKDSDHSADTTKSLWGPASIFCQEQRAFLLMDAPLWKDVQKATHPQTGVNGLRIGLVKDYSAVFYPRLVIKKNGSDTKVGPSGAIAGLMARIDSSRGVWKAPAGTEADLRGIVGVEQRFSDRENGVLNPNAINTIRVFPAGVVNWGGRTMFGYNNSGSEYTYIPIRRLALFMEESLYRGLQWVVFEPNDEPLWAQIRLNVGAFLHGLFRQGAFEGATPKQAYFVKCDSETTTPADQNLGIVNIIVGFAPLKPAEFVILSIQQIARALGA